MSKTPATMAAAFEDWRHMNAVLPTLVGTLNDRMCDRICAIEADMLALPVATVKDLWSLVAAVLDPPDAGDDTFEAQLARRALRGVGVA